MANLAVLSSTVLAFLITKSTFKAKTTVTIYIMASINDIVSPAIQSELNDLNLDLDQVIPANKADNLLIATWNLRRFGKLTQEWVDVPDMSPKRNLHALRCIIEIIKRFDIIAVQEVTGNLKCLRDTMRYLGDDWSFLMTDETKGPSGNHERLAFIFKNSRVKLSGLACEIVIPDEELDTRPIKPDALTRQFARTPYAVSFKAKDKTFVLLTLHVLFGKKPKDRKPELLEIAGWIKDWAKELNDWGHSLIILGDFNIERKEGENFTAFTSTGLKTPPELISASRSVFDKMAFYDQIAWYIGKINLKYLTGGSYDFTKSAMKSLGITLDDLSYRISDHFPLFVEFGLTP
jgi:endonuclease/exonuclease/phosphatase family metal-dependent hydrolase